MGRARHLLSLLVLTVALGIAAGGCGSSADEGSTGDTDARGASQGTAPVGSTVRTCGAAIAGIEEVRASSVGCDEALEVVSSWRGTQKCGAPSGSSRVACSIDAYRCLGTATDRGLAVSCARPGRSISFIAESD